MALALCTGLLGYGSEKMYMKLLLGRTQFFFNCCLGFIAYHSTGYTECYYMKTLAKKHLGHMTRNEIKVHLRSKEEEIEAQKMVESGFENYDLNDRL